MSSDGADTVGTGLPDEFLRLRSAVRRLADEAEGYRARARVAEERVGELEGTLRDLSSGALDPMELRRRLEELEEENEGLRGRMEAAEERIRRLIARFDFLREELE